MRSLTGRALSVRAGKRDVQQIALVLHGGAEKGEEAVRPWDAGPIRMLPFAWTLYSRGRSAGLATATLRFSVRGWNGAAQSPVHDAWWALDELAARYPGVSIAVVGHSMGGRTALYAADHPAVSTLVALAPWIEAADPLPPPERRMLIVHGMLDVTTRPEASQAFAERAGATFVGLENEGHRMIGRPRTWHDLTARFVLGEDVPAGIL